MAELWRYDGGGVPRKVREVWRYDPGGTPRKAREIWRFDAAGVARKVFSGTFVATVSPTQIRGSGNTITKGASCTAITGSVAVTIEGGTGPFTYDWKSFSGTSAFTLTPTAATLSFRRTAVAPTKLASANTYSGVMRCTITDAGTGEVKTVDVVVVTEHWYDF